MRDIVVLSRAELYELVWREPATKVAERFGITGTGLRKICDKHDIPVPPRGHWAKVAANKKVTRARLPRPREGDKRIILNHGWRSSIGQAVSDGHASKRAEPVVAQREFEAQPENKIVVDVERARRGAWSRELNAFLRRGDSYYGSRVDYRGMREARLESGALSLVVSDAPRPRALAIVDALEAALRKRRLLKGGREERRVVVEGVELHLRLSERANRTPRPKKPRRSDDDLWLPTRGNDYAPSGVLQLRVISGDISTPSMERRLVEAPEEPLEGSLNEVMVLVVEVAVRARLKEARLAEQHRQRQVERERQEEERRRELGRLEAERLRREAKAARTRQLLELSERWARAEQLRAFIAAVEAGGRMPADVTEETTLEEWVAWARCEALSMDPLRGED